VKADFTPRKDDARSAASSKQFDLAIEAASIDHSPRYSYRIHAAGGFAWLAEHDPTIFCRHVYNRVWRVFAF
jgi:hypothetical protein